MPVMVQVVESERQALKGGHKLFTAAFLPDGEAGTASAPTAVLCWHHGVGEHVGRYKLRESGRPAIETGNSNFK